MGYEGTLEASFAEMTELGSSVEDDCMVYGGSITGGIRPYANAKAHERRVRVRQVGRHHGGRDPGQRAAR